MGKFDSLTKQYMADNAVFADAFNFYIYDGEQVIKPENLRPLDTTAIAIPFGADGKNKTVQKYRDEFKYVTAKADDNAAYLVLGIENQGEVNPAMPVRNILYDALEYTRQVENISSEHRKSKDYAGHDGGEFLSGFYRSDKIVPVITLVVYFGSEKWDGARSLHEMMNVRDEKILSYVGDYRINLIVPAELNDADFDKFKTDMREIMKYIHCSTDEKKLSELMDSDEKYSHMSPLSAMVLNECTNSGLTFDTSKEVVNMCQAIKDMRSTERTEGRMEGRNEGRAEGRAEGRVEGLLNSIRNLMETLSLTAEQAMNALKIPESERADYLARI